MIKPARVNLGIRPGATFVEQVLLALDAEGVPVDLTGCIPFAQVRDDPNASVVLDLNPSLIVPVTLAGIVIVDVASNLFTLVAHGLKAGMCVQFESTVTLPSPLLESQFYVVMGENLTVDSWQVMLLSDALSRNIIAVDLTAAGSGDLSVKIAKGQILIPEITDEVTEGYSEHPDAGWDLMIEDSTGRRLAPFVTGSFPISRGFTDPAFV